MLHRANKGFLVSWFFVFFISIANCDDSTTTTYLGHGKVSWFGGLEEGKNTLQGSLAIYPKRKISQLDGDSFYCAMRWNYSIYPREILKRSIIVAVSEKGTFCILKPMDWGPHPRTKRLVDLSPGAINHLQIKTDESIYVYIITNISGGKYHIKKHGICVIVEDKQIIVRKGSKPELKFNITGDDGFKIIERGKNEKAYNDTKISR
jgi:hypothetical protein